MTAWQESALCRQVDLELFFPEKGQSTKPAKRVCRRCPVATECAAYATAHDERWGIWGGVSAQRTRRARRRTEAAA